MNSLRNVLLTALLPLATLAGCAEGEPPVVEPTSASESDAAVSTAPAIEAILEEGGDFRFAFEESAVYGVFQAQCSKEPDPRGCLAKVARSASGEGVAITPIEGHRVRYLSYDTDEAGQRRKLLEAEVTLVEVEPGIFELTDGKILVPEGAKPPSDQRFFIEVVDETTIAMDKVPGEHPRKGSARLVFHRGGA